MIPTTTDQELKAAHAELRASSEALTGATEAARSAEAWKARAEETHRVAMTHAISALFEGYHTATAASPSALLVGGVGVVSVRLYAQGWVATYNDTMIGPVPEWDDFGRQLVALVDSLTSEADR